MFSASLNDSEVPAMAQAKRSKCTNQLKKGDQDFFYCTKFAVAKGKRLEADATVKFKRNVSYKKRDVDRNEAKITVAIYNHQQWQKVLAIEETDQESCFKKRDMSLKFHTNDIPLDATENSFKLVYTTVHMAGP